MKKKIFFVICGVAVLAVVGILIFSIVSDARNEEAMGEVISNDMETESVNTVSDYIPNN